MTNRLKLNRIIFLFALFVSLSAPTFAQYGCLDQYRAEIGLTGGTSFYIGDANPTSLFNRSGLALGAIARFKINPRYAIKVSVINANVAGDTRDFPNKYPSDQYAYFERNFWDIGAHMEFNFIDYGLPPYINGNHWFSPYIFIGVGITAGHDERSDLAQVNFNIPYGVGVKCKLYDRLNVGLEWSLHTMFVDNFDVVDENSLLLDNPYGFQGIGNKSKDKYSIANLFISIDLFKRRYCK